MALGRALALALLALALAVPGPPSLGVLAGDCKGQRQVLREAPGFVTDGAGNYSVNGNCEWLIEGECGRGGHPLVLRLIRLPSSTRHMAHSGACAGHPASPSAWALPNSIGGDV
ncbi:multiple epidermal growth factor-like domain protein 8 precursor [Cricetulus griseus]|uniref:Multiple epidermal growth factor-like domain protein 8 n=1 Tax=Cricetulus griseus TaxID=10029 RepID=A0A061HVD7_CRIGR|nr:multiple epidermal growth factor-like domain protein 8 precursor [Cricetulus griseus]